MLLIIDDPPSLPLPPSYPVIDCQNIFVVNVSAISSRIAISLALDNFIEFPKDAILNLLHVVTQSGDFVFDHPLPQLWDLEIHDSNVTFCVLHPIVGAMKGTVFCHNHALALIEHTVDRIDVHAVGFSHAMVRPHMIGSMNDICFWDGTIQYFSHPPASILPMRAVFDHSIPYMDHVVHASAFQQAAPNSTMVNSPTIFISAAPLYAWQHLTDVIIPLWNVIADFGNNVDVKLYLTRNQVNILKNVQKIVPGDPLLNTTNGCFSEVVFLEAPGSLAIDISSPASAPTSQQAIAEHLSSILTLDRSVISGIKQFFTAVAMVPDCIVLDPHLATLFSRLQLQFPTARVVLLPDTDDLSAIADCVAAAMFYIAGHVTTLTYAIFLSPGALLLEVQPNGLECTSFGREWARLAGVQYLPIMTGNCTKCAPNDLFCYLSEDVRHGEIQLRDLQLGLLNVSNSYNKR
jgi:hypothetical protein